MPCRRSVSSANSAISDLSRETRQRYHSSSSSSSSHSSGSGRHRDSSSNSDDETYTRSDGSLDAGAGTETVSSTRSYLKANVTSAACHGFGIATTRRLHVAYDENHQVWHLVSPKAHATREERRMPSRQSEKSSPRKKSSASEDSEISREEDCASGGLSTFSACFNAARVAGSRTYYPGDTAEHMGQVASEQKSEKRLGDNNNPPAIERALQEAIAMPPSAGDTSLMAKATVGGPTRNGEDKVLQKAKDLTTTVPTSTHSGICGDRDQSIGSSQKESSGNTEQAPYHQPATGREDHVPMAPITDDVPNKVSAKSETDIYGKSGDAPPSRKTRSASQTQEEAGNNRSLSTDEKRQVDACERAAATGEETTARTEREARHVTLDAVDGIQRQESNDNGHESARGFNLSVRGEREMGEGGSGDDVADSVTLSGGNELLSMNHKGSGRESSAEVFSDSWGSATERRALADENYAIWKTGGSRLSGGGVWATWRGDTVNFADPIAITLNETKLGWTQFKEKNGGNHTISTPGSTKRSWDDDLSDCKMASDEKRYSWDSADEVFSSEARHRPVASRKASGIWATEESNGSDGESDVARGRQSMPARERLSSTREKLRHGQRRDRADRVKDCVQHRRSRCSDGNIGPGKKESLSASLSELPGAKACAGDIYRSETPSPATARPVYFLSEPYVGPPITEYSRTWPNGTRLLADSSEPKFDELRNCGRRRDSKGQGRSAERKERGSLDNRGTISERCYRDGVDSDNDGGQSKRK